MGACLKVANCLKKCMKNEKRWTFSSCVENMFSMEFLAERPHLLPRASPFFFPNLSSLLLTERGGGVIGKFKNDLRYPPLIIFTTPLPYGGCFGPSKNDLIFSSLEYPALLRERMTDPIRPICPTPPRSWVLYRREVVRN